MTHIVNAKLTNYKNVPITLLFPPRPRCGRFLSPPEVMYRICHACCAIIRTKIRGGGRKRKEKRNEQVQVRDHGERSQDFRNGLRKMPHGSEKARPTAIRRLRHNVVERDKSEQRRMIMTEFESLLRAYLKAESREKRDAAYTALYEHCRNRDELDTLFKEFRKAKTVKKRNDVFAVLFFLRKEGKLDLAAAIAMAEA